MGGGWKVILTHFNNCWYYLVYICFWIHWWTTHWLGRQFYIVKGDNLLTWSSSCHVAHTATGVKMDILLSASECSTTGYLCATTFPDTCNTIQDLFRNLNFDFTCLCHNILNTPPPPSYKMIKTLGVKFCVGILTDRH